MKVLVLGNGFDLELGWKTGYSNFASSTYFPNGSFLDDHTLEKFLYDERRRNTWFDLESSLRTYGTKIQENVNNRDFIDKKYYTSLINNLQDYLTEVTQKQINTQSYAAKILQDVVRNGKFAPVYTFNYTDLDKVIAECGIRYKIPVIYMHGNLKNRSAIVGVDDAAKLHKDYRFLYKTSNSNYASTNLINDLQQADEVIFFGLSFGDVDFPYFQDFFTQFSGSNESGKKRKRATIVTLNEESRVNILNNLREIKNINITELYQKCKLTFAFTSIKDNNVAFAELFRLLDTDSNAADQRRIDFLASALQ